jgi:hypothetical protein
MRGLFLVMWTSRRSRERWREMFCFDTQDNAGNGHGWTKSVVRGDVGNTILLGKVVLQAVSMKPL